MAELVAGSFVTSFFDAIFERLFSGDFLEYFYSDSLENLEEKLKSTLNSINQVFDDAEEKQYKSQDVKKWLGDVKHLAYEADQLLDEMSTDSSLKKLQVESSSIFSGFTPPFNNPFESRIKELLKDLVSLAEEKHILGLKPGNCARDKVGLSPKPSEGLPTVSLVEPDIFGREADKKEVINLLLLEENDIGNQVPVVSIVGLGGMGKTTLAKLVYNDQEINEKFDLRAWVYVSESYDVIGLTKAILKSFNFSAEGEDWNLLQQQLQQQLTGKKYLLVMDDVWNAKWKIWEQILLPFNHGSSGSKIIVTTRDKEVASNMKSTRLHHLKELKYNECWSLFEKHAFFKKNVSHDLVLIGKKIVVKCGGMPLAVKTLANLLNQNFSRSEWLKILETDMWCLKDGDENINPTLRLSYHNLPSNLKRCFAYCSIFPKGRYFDKDEIIKLWMADGLLKCSGVEKSEEELGAKIYRDLESISFFQKMKDWWSDSSYHFGMHDLINDLAKSVSGDFCFQIEGDSKIPKRTRHIWCSIDLKDGERKLEHVYKIKGLRSLMVKSQGYDDQRFKICNNVQPDLFSRLKHLRMLSFKGCLLLELADEISNLQLLRYLNLSDTGIRRLPNSICKLYNLETLLLTNCNLSELPSDFYNLVNLRHLDLEGSDIQKMPKNIGRLIHLRTLTDFVVGEDSGSDINELETLNHLQGTLHISGLEHVVDHADAATANLKDKKYLEKLYMEYSVTNMGDDGEIVLEALQPNDNLNGLTIEEICERFQNWLGDCHLLTLVSLDLSESEFCTLLPPLGQLPSLKKLCISKCERIEIIGEDDDSIIEMIIEMGDDDSIIEMGDDGEDDDSIIEMGDDREVDNSIIEMHAIVLEALQPTKNLNGLTIEEYPGKRFPSWLGGCHLPTLVSLTLTACEFCTHLPPLGQLPSLKELCISKCHGIKMIGEEFYGNNSSAAFKSLEILIFRDLSRWKEWLCPDGCFPSLVSLSIWDCNKLKGALPQHLPFLQELEIRKCQKLEASIPKAANIRKLYLQNCENILINESSLEQILLYNSFLEELTVEGLGFGCPNLRLVSLISSQYLSIEGWRSGLLFALHSFDNLNDLFLKNCPKLESFPRGGLPPNLNNLSILDCPKLIASRKEWGLFQLNSLKHFYVSDEFENVESFPEESLLPPNLSSLTLKRCSKLRVINYRGFLHLKSLTHLYIENCPCLERLPQEGLTNEDFITTIKWCPLLKQLYQKEGGERWQTISHIPKVMFYYCDATVQSLL